MMMVACYSANSFSNESDSNRFFLSHSWWTECQDKPAIGFLFHFVRRFIYLCVVTVATTASDTSSASPPVIGHWCAVLIDPAAINCRVSCNHKIITVILVLNHIKIPNENQISKMTITSRNIEIVAGRQCI